MADYPPYVDAYGSISKLFDGIVKAAVPAKFTQDFISSVLGLKSTSYRAMIPMLKRLGFIDQANAPTEAYKKYRDEALSGAVMAAQLKIAYPELYRAHEFAQKLGITELQGKLRTVLGASEDDPVIPKVAQTFAALVKLANFDQTVPQADVADTSKLKRELKGSANDATEQESLGSAGKRFGLSYTINLNLPATTEVEVFNAIFKSLREYILE